MPDLLTHVLVAYIFATLLLFRDERITPAFVTIVMLGAIVPDLAKIELLLPTPQMEQFLDIPFSWFGIHTLGGTLVAITVGALLASTEYRRRIFLLLAAGAASHLFLDALLIKASGYSYEVLWPLTPVFPPTPNLYLSSDRWPALVCAGVAVTVWYLRYRGVPNGP